MFAQAPSGCYELNDFVRKFEDRKSAMGNLRLDAKFKTMIDDLNRDFKQARNCIVFVAARKGHDMYEFYIGDLSSCKAISGFMYGSEFNVSGMYTSSDFEAYLRPGTMILPLNCLRALFDFGCHKIICNKAVVYNILESAEVPYGELIDVGTSTDTIPNKGGSPCLSCSQTPLTCVSRIGSVLSTAIASQCPDSASEYQPPWNELHLEAAGVLTESWQSAFSEAVESVTLWYTSHMMSIGEKIVELATKKDIDDLTKGVREMDPCKETKELVAFHDIYTKSFTGEVSVTREDIWSKAAPMPGEQDNLHHQIGRLTSKSVLTRAAKMSI